MIQFANQIYPDHSPKNGYEEITAKNASLLIAMTAATTALIILSFTFILIGPIYAYASDGTQSSLLGGMLPFTDLETTQGFIINSIIQSFWGLGALFGSISIEILSCLINNTYTVAADLICYLMRKFSTRLVAGTFTADHKAELRDIFVRLQDFEKFIAELNDLYYWKFFVQPPLITFCVSLGIFAQLEVR